MQFARVLLNTNQTLRMLFKYLDFKLIILIKNIIDNILINPDSHREKKAKAEESKSE